MANISYDEYKELRLSGKSYDEIAESLAQTSAQSKSVQPPSMSYEEYKKLRMSGKSYEDIVNGAALPKAESTAPVVTPVSRNRTETEAPVSQTGKASPTEDDVRNQVEQLKRKLYATLEGDTAPESKTKTSAAEQGYLDAKQTLDDLEAEYAAKMENDQPEMSSEDWFAYVDEWNARYAAAESALKEAEQNKKSEGEKEQSEYLLGKVMELEGNDWKEKYASAQDFAAKAASAYGSAETAWLDVAGYVTDDLSAAHAAPLEEAYNQAKDDSAEAQQILEFARQMAEWQQRQEDIGEAEAAGIDPLEWYGNKYSEALENSKAAEQAYLDAVEAYNALEYEVDQEYARLRDEEGLSLEELDEYLANSEEKLEAARTRIGEANTAWNEAVSSASSAKNSYLSYGKEAGENAAINAIPESNGYQSDFNKIYALADNRASTLYYGDYAEILKRPDYAENSKPRMSMVNPTTGIPYSWKDYDEKYEFINGYGRDRLAATNKLNYRNAKYAFLTEDEKGVYNYLYATEGKKSAEAFLKTLDTELNAQLQSGRDRFDAERAGKNFWSKVAYSVGSIAMAPVRGVEGAISSAQDLERVLSREEIDPNSPYRQVSKSTQAFRYGVSKDFTSAGKFAYDVAMSAGDSAMNMVVAAGVGSAIGLSGDALMAFTNKASAGLMSSEVTSMSIADAKEKGYSDLGAFSLGVARGGIEYLSEEIGGEWVIRYVKENPASFLNALVRSTIPEGVEEIMSDVGNEGFNLLIDKVFGTEESYIGAAYREFEAMGSINPLADTIGVIILQEAESFAAGALSAAGSTSVHYGINQATINKENREAINKSASALNTSPEEIVKLMEETGIQNPEAITQLAELNDVTDVDTLKEVIAYYETAAGAIDNTMRADGVSEGERGAFDEGVSDEQLETLYRGATRALEAKGLNEETAAQLRVLQQASEAELAARRADNEKTAFDNESGDLDNENGGINHAQTEEITEESAGQAQTIEAAGEQTGRAEAAGRASAGPAIGLETSLGAGRESTVFDGGGQRDAGPGQRRGAERLVRNTEELRQRAVEQHRTATSRQSLAASLWERKVITRQSAQELGIASGTDTQNLLVFPQEHYDAEMREVADWVAANYRLPVTYVSGPIFITNRRGEQVRVRGVYTGSGIILQADHSRDTITSLARHEVFHDEAARDAGLVEEIRERIIEEYGEDELRNIVHGYIVALRGTAAAGVSENASDAEIDAAAHEILEEIFADANGGMNAFGYGAHKYESIVNEVRSERAATRGSQANGERETRGPPSQPYSIDEGFADAVQTWYDETKPEQRMSSPGYFHVGTTSDALAGIGARTDNIYMRKYKIGTILDDHPEMSIDEIKKLPEILEHPVLVMKSLTHPDSIVVFGELKAKNGDNVMASVELTPTPGGNTEAEFSLITSAYARTRENIQKLIQNSELLYLDPNKKRTNNWLMQLRVQFPSRQPPFGSIGTISYADDGVNIQGKTLKELGVEMTIAADLDTAKEKISEIPEEQKSPMQKAMEEALRRRAGTEEKYSYAGEEAETADVARLRDAEQMEKDGRSSEEIRQNTGWFRGTDGKWRFEISDRDAVFHRNGDARFLKDHPEYARYLELTEKFLNGAVTAEEMEEATALARTWSSEQARLGRMVKDGNATLDMVLDHPALFEAYPELRGVKVRFTDGTDGEKGNFDRKKKTITLTDTADAGTIFHEIQHAIQQIEGFTRGSSVEYWQDQIKDGYEKKRKTAEIEEADRRYRELFDNAPEELKNQIRKLNQAKLNNDLDRWDQIEAELYEGPYAELFSEIDNADFERRRIRYSEYQNLNAEDLYRSTAGEIEARDVARRRSMTDEHRKQTPPDLGDENTVFADEGDKSFALRDKKIPTREELEAKDDIRVVDIREETSGSYKEQRQAFLDSEEAQELYRAPALNRDTNELLFITPKSITHTFNNEGRENILLAKHLREIAESAILTHGEPSRKAPRDHTTGVYKFFGAVQTENGVQPVKLTVKEYSVEGQDVPKAVLDYVGDLQEGDTYAPIYDGKVLVLESIEKETSSSAPSPSADAELDKHPSVSVISVKELLDLVKGEDAKYIHHLAASESARYSMDDSELPGAIWGDEDETYVNDTEPVRFRWAIVPIESLTLSNDASGSINPAYPAELQPRDRTRPESQMQIQRISQAINPRQLESSPNAQNGAPIIRGDGVMISGNGRGLALADAYEKGRAEQYRDFIRERGRRYGLDTAELPEHPVLVRVAEGVSDWTKLARDSNTSTVASMSATERAMTDAKRLDDALLGMLMPDEEGNINSAGNRGFIQQFVSKVIPDTERVEAVTKSGLLSQDGLARAEYAIFAKAYGDPSLMQRLSESLDNDMKNVTNALLDIAPRVVQTEAAVDAGQMYDVKAAENIKAAVQLYAEAKQAGKTVEEYTANYSLTNGADEFTIYAARFIEKNKRSAKQIRMFLNGLFEEIESYGDPNQLNFFGEEEEHSYQDALEGAIKRYERATGTELPRLGEWGSGSYEATVRGNESREEQKSNAPVHDSGRGEDGEQRRGVDGGRDTEVEAVESEIPEDTGLHLPPPPGMEETAAELTPNETRQRDLERMARKLDRRQQKQQKKAKKQLAGLPFTPEYDPLEQYRGSADPVKEFIKASQARAAAAKVEKQMQADKNNFTATPALQKLGVHIQNSVGIYRFVDQIRAREKAAYQLRKTIRKREAALNATAKEKAFAAGMAAGIYTAEDIPGNMNRAKLEELADYYWAEKAVASDMIAQRRKDINLELDAQMDELLKDSELYKVPPAVVLNYRTPERLCRSIWGDEHGQAIYDAIFRPVSINEAEKTRFINRMFDEVRTFEGRDGKRSGLNKNERMLVQQVLEGCAVEELVASMEMHEAVEDAANNILKGTSSLDAAREFQLTADEKGIAEQYARWLQTKQVYDSGEFDSVKIDNAVKKYSEMYDKMYDAINDFLVAHGYDPIGFIKGYAPHMQMGEDLNLFAGYLERLGFNTNVTRLPANIAGKTVDYKPNKRWNPYFLQRNGDMTDFDIAKGFESYVNYLSDVLYHTDDIMRVRAMSRYYRRTFAPDEIRETLDWVHYNENASPEVKEDMLKSRGIIARDSQLSQRDILATFDEWVDKQYESVENMAKYSDYVSYLDNYANILAGKQSSIDRGAEALLGRESLTWGNKLVNSFQRTQVAGSFSSALNQSAQLPQIKAELGDKYTLKAVADFVNGSARKGAWAQESDFLTGKHGVDMLVTDAFDMVMEKAFAPATFVDGLMSTIAVRGKYLQQIDAGKSHAEAMKAADEFGRKIMGSRVKGEKPIGFQSKRPVVQMLNMFQIEALNSWEHLSQDLPADFRAIEKQHGTAKAAASLAGVIVKMLLSAFLLNRLGEELYGGTPAPFDIIGLTCNFIASGKGLTTNQYLKTVIDNGMEKLTGNRVLGTDPDKMRQGFDVGDAFEDVGYNISNDIPFLRNIAGLMGWGDQTLPLPLMGAGKDLKYLFSDLKNDISEGHLSAETGMDLLRIMNQALPGGRQLTKTAEGLQLMSQGGRYVNGRLYYPVENSWTNWVKALLFGRSSLNESDAYYAGDDKSLSAAQTEMYRALTGDGADRFEVYEAIQDYKAVSADSDLGSYEKGRREREIITNADLTDEQRLTLYRGMSSNNEGRAEDFEEIMESGLGWAETVKAYDKWAELNANEDMSKSAKAEAFAAWVGRQDYTDKERAAIREHFRFWQSIPIETTKVDKFTEAGMEIDEAEQMSGILHNLQALPGKTAVTDLQKYQAIADSDLNVEDQWTAIIAQTNPSYTSTLAKIEIFRQQGITPSVWTASKEAMYAADDAGNNNDSTDQKEAKAALDGMDIPIWQKAILWQTANTSWKPSKNPYDKEIGQAIYDQLHGGKQADAIDGSLQLGTWGQDSGFTYTAPDGTTFTFPAK